MTSIKCNSEITTNITLTITEEEARALLTLTEYGTQSFLEVFYAKLGKHYLIPHEQGLRSLFETIKKELPVPLNNVNKARNLLKNNNL